MNDMSDINLLSDLSFLKSAEKYYFLFLTLKLARKMALCV